MNDERDSLWPHALAIVRSPRVQVWLLKLFKVVVPLVFGSVLMPAYKAATGWRDQVVAANKDHLKVENSASRVEELQAHAAKLDSDRQRDQRRERVQLAALGRQLVEVALVPRKLGGKAHKDYTDDYERLVEKWRDGIGGVAVCDLVTQDVPDGKCHTPAEAARMALDAQHR